MSVVAGLARLTNPLLWASPGRNVRRLQAFARSELNTLVELEQAANLTASPERAAAYLKHGSDEARHARMFTAHARRIAARSSLPPPSDPRTDSTHLFEVLGELDFLAFTHQGELRARLQFETYQAHLQSRDPQGSAMFEAILVDERRHETYSAELLHVLTADGAARVARMGRWQAYRAVRGLQRGTAQLLFGLSVLLLVPLLVPLALWTRWMRAEQRGWTL